MAFGTVVVPRGRTEPLTWTLMWKGAPANLSASGDRALDIATILIYLVRTNQWLSETFDASTVETYLGAMTKKVDGASCSIVTAAAGDISWAPGADDLNTPGNYYYQFKATDSGGKITPWPDDARHCRFIVAPSIWVSQ